MQVCHQVQMFTQVEISDEFKPYPNINHKYKDLWTCSQPQIGKTQFLEKVVQAFSRKKKS